MIKRSKTSGCTYKIASSLVLGLSLNVHDVSVNYYCFNNYVILVSFCLVSGLAWNGKSLHFHVQYLMFYWLNLSFKHIKCYCNGTSPYIINFNCCTKMANCSTKHCTCIMTYTVLRNDNSFCTCDNTLE